MQNGKYNKNLTTGDTNKVYKFFAHPTPYFFKLWSLLFIVYLDLMWQSIRRYISNEIDAMCLLSQVEVPDNIPQLSIRQTLNALIK